MIRRLLVWYTERGHLLHGVAIVVYLGLIFALSSMKFEPVLDIDFVETLFFNFCHVPLYLGLSIPLALYGRKIFEVEAGGPTRWNWILFTVSILIVYAISDEYHQSFTGREPAVMDLVNDAIGGIGGLLVISYILDGRPGRKDFWLSCASLFGAALLLIITSIR